MRIQCRGDRRGGAVQLDTGQLRTLWCEPDEGPGAGARLKHFTAGETEALQRSPHLGRVCGIRVVRVDGGAPRLEVLRLVQQGAQLVSLGIPALTGLVEDLRQCAPARPTRERCLLFRNGLPSRRLELTRELDRCDVGGEAGLRP